MEEKSRKQEFFKFCHRFLDFKSIASNDENERRKFGCLKRKFEFATQVSFNSPYVFNLLQKRRYREAIEYYKGFLFTSPRKYFSRIEVRRFIVQLVLLFYEQCEVKRNEGSSVTDEEGSFMFGIYLFLFRYCAQEMNELNLWKRLKIAMGDEVSTSSSSTTQNLQNQAIEERKLHESFFRSRVHFPPEKPIIKNTSFLQEFKRMDVEENNNNQTPSPFFSSELFNNVFEFFQTMESNSQRQAETRRKNTDLEVRKFKQQQIKKSLVVGKKKKKKKKKKKSPPPPPIIHPPPPTRRRHESRTYNNNSRRRNTRKSKERKIILPPRRKFITAHLNERFPGVRRVVNIRIPEDIIENRDYEIVTVCLYHYESRCSKGDRCERLHISKRNLDPYLL